MAFRACIHATLVYPLVGQRCTLEDLAPIQSIVDREVCHSLGLNEHCPRAVLHGPTEFGGLAVPSLYSEDLAAKIVFFLHHMRVQDEVGQKLKVSLAHVQLEVGIGVNFFQTDFADFGPLVTPCWVAHLWKACSRLGFSLQCVDHELWIPPLQGPDDA